MTTSTAASRLPTSLSTSAFSVSLPPLAVQTIELLDLKASPRRLPRGREIVTEGRPCSAVFLISDGVAIRYRILRDGQRQIVNILLPGDFAGITACRFDTAIFSIKTLTPSVVYPIPLARLASLSDSQPRLAGQLLWSFAAETAVIAEHLIAIGRRTASERLAHFLLELLVRLRRIGLAENNSFRLPLTQEIIGDALGLSIPYVNRVLHQLQDEGLVVARNQRFQIRNMEELAALADFKQDYLQPRPIGGTKAAVASLAQEWRG
jgi:CRP-like cAMP-binding protein